MTYSFCTICKGRLHTLREVFHNNMRFARYGREFILLDYGSTDGLGKWVKKEAGKYIEDKTLVYAKINRKYLNLSHAKNLAHLMGCGRVLINLDADNILTEEYMLELDKAFSKGVGVTILHTNAFSSITGRIAISSELFYSLKGYNESFKFYGYEDIDLVERARRAGARVVSSRGEGWKALDNTIVEKWQHFNTNTIDLQSYAKNKQISLANLAKGNYTGNGYAWGEGRLRVNFRETLVI